MYQSAIDDCNKAIELDTEGYYLNNTYYNRGLAKIGLGKDGCQDLRKALVLSEVEEVKKKVEDKLAEFCKE